MRCYSHLSDDEREQIGLAKALNGGQVHINIGLPAPEVSSLFDDRPIKTRWINLHERRLLVHIWEAASCAAQRTLAIGPISKTKGGDLLIVWESLCGGRSIDPPALFLTAVGARAFVPRDRQGRRARRIGLHG
jgi:hypothetical protein